MKKAFATFCLVGGALTLSACDTTGMGDQDTQPPYSLERTATHTKGAAPAEATSKYAAPTRSTPSRVAPAERVFQRAQTK